MTAPASVRSGFLFAITFLFVFGWKITALADLILIVSVLVSVTAYMLWDRDIDRRILALSWPMLALAGVALVHTALSDQADTQLAERSLRAAINTLGAAALCTLYAREETVTWRHTIMRHVFWSIAAHGALVIAMYLVPPLRTTVYAMTHTAQYINDTSSFKMGLRIPGLTYGLSQTSVLHLFGVLMAPLIAASTRGNIMRALIGLASLVIAGSTLLVGRTGLFLGVLLIPAVLVLGRAHTVGPRRIGHVALPAAIIAGCAAAAIGLILQRLPEQFVLYNLAHAGEVLVAFTSPGESGTVRAVQAMYLMPTDVTSLLVGEGTLGRDAFQYLASDVGYVRILFAAGLLGSMLLLAPFVGAIVIAFRAWGPDRRLAATTLVCLLATLLLHMKEVALLTRNQWSVQAILICCCLAAADDRIRAAAARRDADVITC
jgi:hypothetical protein